MTEFSLTERLDNIEEKIRLLNKYVRLPDGRYVWNEVGILEQRVAKLEDRVL